MPEDPRLRAARYRLEREARAAGEEPEEEQATDAPSAAPRTPNLLDRAAYVETAIQQAIRRGEFDDLPGYGKPLEGLGDHHDPDWWIRRKIESEKLTGLGPPALTLRVEHAEMEERLDELTREQDVREYLEDFNRRVIEARRQLLGGPPVVTPTRDVEGELAAWRDRREARAGASDDSREADDDARRRRRWWRRDA